MEMEIGRIALGRGADNPSPHLSVTNRRLHYFHRFTQQNLPACKPILTPGWVIAVFLVTGMILLPTGLIVLQASQSIVEIVDRYDNDCVPDEFRGNKVAYIKDSSISKNCVRQLRVRKRMRAPINVYYQLDNFYQNHRRYVKSRSDSQLKRRLKQEKTDQCQPLDSSNGLPIVPCGLIAWSLFNDTFHFSRGGAQIQVNRKNIAWSSDRAQKFGDDVFPFNFQNGTLIGGGHLDPTVPLSEQEDLMVWMRVAALPSFRKLYGRINVDFDRGDVVEVRLVNNYNTYSFGGKKKLVLSTSHWLGGKNDFLGGACAATGGIFVLTAVAFALLHVRNPRPCADPTILSWSGKRGLRGQ